MINKEITSTYNVATFLEVEWSKQKEHLIIWFPVLLGIGVSIYYSLSYEPRMLLLFFVSGTLLPITLYLKLQRKWSYVPFLAISLIILGLSVGSWRSYSVHAPQLQKEYKFANIEGLVKSIEERENGSKRLLLSKVKIEGVKGSETPYYIRVSMRQKNTDIEVGQYISMLASIRPPSPAIMPDGFNFQRYFYFKRIGGTGFTMSAPKLIKDRQAEDNDKPSLVTETLFNISEDMKKAVYAKPSEANAVVQALLTGERGLITQEDWDHLRDSGLSHMLAISGLHVGLFSATVFFIVRLLLSLIPNLTLRFPIKKMAAVLAFSAALFYTLLVGASVPTVRACVMTGMFFLAILMDRSPFSVHLLAFSAFVILVIRPEALMSASFQMSFAAVAGLIIFYSSTRGWWTKQYAHASVIRRLFMYLLGVIATTVIATLVTMPFTLYHFQHISVYGVLGNMLAVPIMAFIVMPMAVFAYFLLSMDLSQWALAIMRFGVEKILDISAWVSSLSGSIITMPTMPFIGFCMFVIAGMILLIVRGRFKIASILPFIAGIIIIMNHSPADIYISSNGKLWGVHKNDKLYVSNTRKDKFTQKQWHGYLGEHDGHATPFPKSGCLDGICCDADGCRVSIDSASISLLKQKYIIHKECSSSDLLVAPFSISSKWCKDTPSIDWYGFKEQGAYFIWVDDDGNIKTKTSEEKIKSRPWNKILE